MTGHVDDLIAAYVEGQLSSKQVALVRQHVAACQSCREKLALHERLSADLRLILGQALVPPSNRVMLWWRVVNKPISPPVLRPLSSLLWPVALTLLALVMPLTIGFGVSAVAASPTPGGTPVEMGAVAISEFGPALPNVLNSPEETPKLTLAATPALESTLMPTAFALPAPPMP